MHVTDTPHPDALASLFADRGSFQVIFGRLLTAEPALKGRVLDIGCGDAFPTRLDDMPSRCGQIDGVDPSPAVATRTEFACRWQGFFEEQPIPPAAYDLAYAYNVVEHIPAARPFFQAVRRILKPGGIFWALTPQASHPFCPLARGIEVVGGKLAAHRLNEGVNPYPAYYRLNSRTQVLRALDGLGFARADFHYLPCVNWDTYFPRPLRFLPHLYDRLLGARRPRAMLLLAYRLEAAG